MALGGMADDVARAVAEFGDDAVRSVMKASPELRKRLAALAKSRAETVAKRATNEAHSVVDRVRELPESLEKTNRRLDLNAVENYNIENLSKALDRMFKSAPIPKSAREQVGPVKDLADLEDRLSNVIFLDDALDTKYWDDLAILKNLEGRATQAAKWRQASEEALQNAESSAYSAMQVPPMRRRLEAAIEKAETARKDYDDAVLGITTEGAIPADMTTLLRAIQTRGSGLFEVEDALRNALQAPMILPDIAPAIDQARLLSILRALGDAQ